MQCNNHSDKKRKQNITQHAQDEILCLSENHAVYYKSISIRVHQLKRKQIK